MNTAIGIAFVLIFFALFFLLCVALMSYSTLVRISEHLAAIREYAKAADHTRAKAPRDAARAVMDELNRGSSGSRRY